MRLPRPSAWHPTTALLLLIASCWAALAQPAQEGNGPFAANVRAAKRPRLTVVISIDQFRADYLGRLGDLFLPARSGGKVGGFRYLMTQGSYFVDARYGHYPTFTGPGHAIILTGSYPYKTGIVGNEWWDRSSQSVVYCVDDPRWKVVGAAASSKAKPMGPQNLRVTTVGDELKLATAGAAKVVTLALKDRAAILLGGHSQDVSLWFDDYSGGWISSTAYCKNGALPAWVSEENAKAAPDRMLGQTWNLAPEWKEAVLKRALPPNLPGMRNPYGLGLAFPHPVGKERVRNNYLAFTRTPAANAYVFDTAKRAVTAEKLGQRGAPDMLAINLSTNDYIGHTFGPYSPEALDITLHTDRQISDFLNFLQVTVPGGLREVVFVVTADHGVVPIVENLQRQGITAERVLESKINDAAQKALQAAYGGEHWVGNGENGKAVGGYVDPYVFLNEAEIAQALRSGKAKSRAEIEETAADAIAALPGIYACYTHSQIRHGQLPTNEITRRVVNGFYPKVSGDIVVVTEAAHYTDSGLPSVYSTSHGTVFAYDTHVPILIAGPGIRPGVWADPVSPADIAPTLCTLLGIEYPSGCDGVLLKPALH